MAPTDGRTVPPRQRSVERLLWTGRATPMEACGARRKGLGVTGRLVGRAGVSSVGVRGTARVTDPIGVVPSLPACVCVRGQARSNQTKSGGCCSGGHRVALVERDAAGTYSVGAVLAPLYHAPRRCTPRRDRREAVGHPEHLQVRAARRNGGSSPERARKESFRTDGSARRYTPAATPPAKRERKKSTDRGTSVRLAGPPPRRFPGGRATRFRSTYARTRGK